MQCSFKLTPLTETLNFLKMNSLKTPNCVSVKKAAINPRGYRNFLDWSFDSKHLYIGRDMQCYVEGAVGSKWQNPFTVKKYGLTKCLELYEEKIRNSPKFMLEIIELEGMELGCWCKPDPCHGDVLIKIFKEVVKCFDD